MQEESQEKKQKRAAALEEIKKKRAFEEQQAKNLADLVYSQPDPWLAISQLQIVWRRNHA